MVKKRYTVKKGIRRKNKSVKYNRINTRKVKRTRRVKKKNHKRVSKKKLTKIQRGGENGYIQKGDSILPVYDIKVDPGRMGKSFCVDKNLFQRKIGWRREHDPTRVLDTRWTSRAVDAGVLAAGVGAGIAAFIASGGLAAFSAGVGTGAAGAGGAGAAGAAATGAAATGAAATGAAATGPGMAAAKAAGVVLSPAVKLISLAKKDKLLSSQLNEYREKYGLTFESLYNLGGCQPEMRKTQRFILNVGGVTDGREAILLGMSEDKAIAELLSDVENKEVFFDTCWGVYKSFLGNDRNKNNRYLNEITKGNLARNDFNKVTRMFLLNDWCFSCITVMRKCALHGLYLRDAFWNLNDGKRDDKNFSDRWTELYVKEYEDTLEKMIEMFVDLLHYDSNDDESHDHAEAYGEEFADERAPGDVGRLTDLFKTGFEAIDDFKYGRNEKVRKKQFIEMLENKFGGGNDYLQNFLQHIRSSPRNRILHHGEREFCSLAIDFVLIIAFLYMLISRTASGPVSVTGAPGAGAASTNFDSSEPEPEPEEIRSPQAPTTPHRTTDIISLINGAMKVEEPGIGRWKPVGEPEEGLAFGESA